MGFPKKHQVGVSQESEGKKWVIAGIAIVAPLKQISTTRVGEDCEADDDDGACSTTPKARESKLPEKLPCPPPPRKRRPTPMCHFNGVIEFFNPPDLESVFTCHAERAK